MRYPVHELALGSKLRDHVREHSPLPPNSTTERSSGKETQRPEGVVQPHGVQGFLCGALGPNPRAYLITKKVERKSENMPAYSESPILVVEVEAPLDQSPAICDE